MNYRLNYESNRVAYGEQGGHPATEFNPLDVFYRYNRNLNASSYGLTTYNPTGGSITIENYDLYYPVTDALPQINTVRVFIGAYDIDTDVISCVRTGQVVNLIRSGNMDDSLPATIETDGVTFYRHHFVIDGSTDIMIPMGWSAQVFFGHNGNEYDPWDDVANQIYPLCTSQRGEYSSDGTNLYKGIVTKSSTTTYIRQEVGRSYRCNYEEIMTYPADPPVYPNIEDMWCTPTAVHEGIRSRFNIFPYIHLNGDQI